jgi:hypothetical protein
VDRRVRKILAAVVSEAQLPALEVAGEVRVGGGGGAVVASSSSFQGDAQLPGHGVVVVVVVRVVQDEARSVDDQMAACRLHLMVEVVASFQVA